MPTSRKQNFSSKRHNAAPRKGQYKGATRLGLIAPSAFLTVAQVVRGILAWLQFAHAHTAFGYVRIQMTLFPNGVMNGVQPGLF